VPRGVSHTVKTWIINRKLDLDYALAFQWLFDGAYFLNFKVFNFCSFIKINIKDICRLWSVRIKKNFALGLETTFGLLPWVGHTKTRAKFFISLHGPPAAGK